jgi:hypothetical protein
MSNIDPEVVARVSALTDDLLEDMDAKNAEIIIRLKAAPRRMEIDAEFAYRVLFLSAIQIKMKPALPKRIALKDAMIAVIASEVVTEQIEGRL